MNKRPTSVTVIAWILIIMGTISILTSTVTINNPMAREIMSKSPLPISLQYVMMFAGILIMIVSGVAMLKRRNWGRFLYVTWTAFAFVVGFATSPMPAMIPSVVLFAVITFFLLRPKASDYFLSPEPSTNAQSG